MDSPEHQELLRQLAELRREARILRRWLVFISAGVAIPLFTPQFAALIASYSARFIDLAVEYLSPLAAIAFLIVVAAFVVSHFAASAPKSSQGRTRDA